jgi:hypothetical protein
LETPAAILKRPGLCSSLFSGIQWAIRERYLFLLTLILIRQKEAVPNLKTQTLLRESLKLLRP